MVLMKIENILEMIKKVDFYERYRNWEILTWN